MTALALDFNELETGAQKAFETGAFERAISIYTWMADGDQSLDGGYLAERLGECYEQLGNLFVAHYWYNRAVEQNPEVCLKAQEALKRLDQLNVADLLKDTP